MSTLGSTLARFIDNSSYGVREWEEAIEVIEAWLRSQKLVASDYNKWTYISCCAESLKSTEQSLAMRTQEMLQNFGFEAAKPAP